MSGYPKLAQLMGRHNEIAIFRRFQTLNMQNLLYLQAELTILEDDLKYLAARDSENENRPYHDKDWWSLSQSEDEIDREQWEKFTIIREKLKEYNDALEKIINLSKVKGPVPHDINFLRTWLVRPSMGDCTLLGLDRHSYGPDHEQDLIALDTRISPNKFSRWFTDYVVPRWHRVIGKYFKSTTSEDLGNGLYDYKESLLTSILRVTITVIASLLPMCSVVVLYCANTNVARLGIVVAASAVFALALALMTNSRTIEVFAATSAFAAVNVVFLANGVTTGD